MSGVIGVDIGGTFVKIGLVQGAGVRLQRSLPTAAYRTPKALQDGIVQEIRSILREGGRARAVGIGVAGLVRFPDGVVHTCANIRGWKDVPLRSLLQRRLGMPVRVDNDVNVMTLAEWTYGAGRGADDLLCITLGTGVGGGLILGGRLYRGCGGGAGEIGHCPLGEEGPGCSCGGTACLERYVGNREVLAWVRRRLARGVKSRIPTLVGRDLNRVTPELIDRAAYLGDPFARDVWRWVGSRVGLALAGVVNLLDLERIVVGGGIAKAGRWLFEPMRRTLQERRMRKPYPVLIVPARLGSSAGLIGAALLGRERSVE